jgi:hypothetical protein
LLVIVAKARSGPLLPEEPRTGIALEGGFHEPDGSRRCPVILVSDGRVNIENDFDVNDSGEWASVMEMTYLSVFARNAMVLGPRMQGTSPGTRMMRLVHPTNFVHDLPGGVVHEMVRQGKLPNTQGSILNRLQPIAGTWTETP